MDVLYVNVIEFFLYATITNFVPILITDISLIEYLIVSLILFVHSIYLHSESTHTFLIPLFTDSKSHKNHHQIGGGNYSFLSIWDEYMTTNIKPQKNKNKNKNKNKEKQERKKTTAPHV
jgi:sterol desaturase/sphingolipid hydroxylase (fatty acid hydroxylase superfamily)